MEARIQKNKTHDKYVRVKPAVEKPLMIGRRRADAFKTNKSKTHKPRHKDIIWELRMTLYRLGFLNDDDYFLDYQRWMKEVDWL